MAWLSAALAFVVAMILFSTIASAATESLHRVFHMRERGLRKTLERLFDDVVWPSLSPDGPADAPQAIRDDFLDVLTRNRAVRPLGPTRSIGYWFAPRSISCLDTTELVARLAETQIGKALTAAGDAEVEAVVRNVARQFERLGADASASFEERARAVSISVAMLVAFALNIDAVRLFSSLVAQPELAAKLIHQEETSTHTPPSGDEAEGAVTSAEMGASVPSVEVASLVREGRQQAEAAVALGLPIGYAYFPWCSEGGVGTACDALRRARADDWYAGVRMLWVRWLLFTVLSGLLIGLGGPFWFNTFVRLSSVMQPPHEPRGTSESTANEVTVVAKPEAPVTAADAFRGALPPELLTIEPANLPVDVPDASGRSWIPR